MRKPERGLRGLTRIKGLSHPSTLRSGASPIADQGCAATEDGRPSMSWVVKFCGMWKLESESGQPKVTNSETGMGNTWNPPNAECGLLKR